MVGQIDIRYALASKIVGCLTGLLLFCAPASGQWQVQAGYSYAGGRAAHGGVAQVQYEIWEFSHVSIVLRGEGHYHRGNGHRGNWESVEQSFQVNFSPLLETRVSQIRFRSGLTIGGQQYNMRLECGDHIQCLTPFISEQARNFAAGGLVEISYVMAENLFPFLSYRRTWVSADSNWPAVPTIINSLKLGIGIDF